MIRCPVCATTNRIPREKVEQGLTPKCGRCKNPLPIHLEPLTVTDGTFVYALGGRTIERALADGEDPKVIWRAVCDTFDVPEKLR